jgi:hypothetical protein
MDWPYYQNGCPQTCAGCGHAFREYDGQKIAVHVHGLGYFCCAEHTPRPRVSARRQKRICAPLHEARYTSVRPD